MSKVLSDSKSCADYIAAYEYLSTENEELRRDVVLTSG